MSNSYFPPAVLLVEIGSDKMSQFTVLKVVLLKTESLPISGKVDSVAVILKPELTSSDVFAAIIQKLRKTFGQDSIKPEHVKPFKLYFRRSEKAEPRKLASDELIWDLVSQNPGSQVVFTPKTSNPMSFRRSVHPGNLLRVSKSASKTLSPSSSSSSSTGCPLRVHPGTSVSDLFVEADTSPPRHHSPRSSTVTASSSLNLQYRRTRDPASLDAISRLSTASAISSASPDAEAPSRSISLGGAALSAHSGLAEPEPSHGRPAEDEMLNNVLNNFAQREGVMQPVAVRKLLIGQKPSLLNLDFGRKSRSRPASLCTTSPRSENHSSISLSATPPSSPHPSSSSSTSVDNSQDLHPSRTLLIDSSSPEIDIPGTPPSKASKSPTRSVDEDSDEDEEELFAESAQDIFGELLDRYADVRASLRPVQTADKSVPHLEPVPLKRVAPRSVLLSQISLPVILKSSGSTISREIRVIVDEPVSEPSLSEPKPLFASFSSFSTPNASSSAAGDDGSISDSSSASPPSPEASIPSTPASPASESLGGRNRYSTLLQDLVRYRDQGAVPDPQWFAQVREILLEHEKQEESVLNVQNKRQNIIREINSVEKHYVASLQTTVNSFQTPLEEEKLISSEQSEVLFSSLRTIRDDHQKFYSLLKSNLTSRSLGEVFTKLENSLHGYSQYMANYSQAAQLIAQLETQEPFIAFMKRPALRKKIGTFTLLDFLIRPVQQVPRYSMLLSQLQTVTPTGMNQTTTNHSFSSSLSSSFFCIFCFLHLSLSLSLSLSLDHSDYQPLTAALNRVREIAIALNESSSRSENVAAIKAIQTKINQGHSRMRQAGLINLMSEPDRFFTFEADLLWPTTQRRKTRWVQLHC
ncbi:MAG: RhoGEF domain-containing protein, partial [archaeon]|nr:RhoGEF domain-containing protein [archaeon]